MASHGTTSPNTPPSGAPTSGEGDASTRAQITGPHADAGTLVNTDEDLAAAAILVWMASGGHENAQSQVPVAGASADIQEQADEDHVTVESSGAAKRRFVRAMKRELLGLNHERANPPRALNRPARTGNTVGVELTTPSAGLPGTASSEMEEEEQEESHQPREERETGDEEEPQHKYKRLPEEKGDVFRW